MGCICGYIVVVWYWDFIRSGLVAFLTNIKLSLWSNYYLCRSSQVNVSKTFALPVSYHILHCWHILNIIGSVSDESLKALVGLYLEESSKSHWDKKQNIIFLRLSRYYFFIMWFSVASQDFWQCVDKWFELLESAQRVALFQSTFGSQDTVLATSFWVNSVILIICSLNLQSRKISFSISKCGK